MRINTLQHLILLGLSATFAAPAAAQSGFAYELRLPSKWAIDTPVSEPPPAPLIPLTLETHFTPLQRVGKGETATGTHTLTNPNNTPVILGTPSSNLTLASSTCGNTLAASASCTLTYSWSPTIVNENTIGRFVLTWEANGESADLVGDTPIHSRDYASFNQYSYWGGEAKRIADGVTYSNNGRSAFLPATMSINEGLSLHREFGGAPTAGTWYAEFSISHAGPARVVINVGNGSESVSLSSDGANGYSNRWAWGSTASGWNWTDTGVTSQATDVIGVRLNVDARKIEYWLHRNGTCSLLATLSNVLAAGSPHYVATTRWSNTAVTVNANTGQASFKCHPPVGYNPGYW